MRKKISLLILIMVLLTAAGTVFTIVMNEKPLQDKEKITIVTSFYPVYIAAKNIVKGIDGTEVVNLTENQSGCVHDYQLSTKDMKKLEKADVFILNGGGIDDFARNAADSYSNLKQIDSSFGIPLLESAEEGHMEEHGHDHGEHNAHFWLNPDHYQVQVQNIADGLSAADPVHKEQYKQNSSRYIKKINKLSNTIKSELANPKEKKVVIFHDAFAYLAEKIGIEAAYTVDLDENTSLSAKENAHIIDIIHENKIKILLTEKQYNSSIPDSIAKETGSQIYTIDTLVTGDGGIDSYLEGMYQNIKTLKQVLY